MSAKGSLVCSLISLHLNEHRRVIDRMKERWGDIAMINISMMEKTINSMQKKYLRYVKSGQRKKKRELDVHLDPQGRENFDRVDRHF